MHIIKKVISMLSCVFSLQAHVVKQKINDLTQLMQEAQHTQQRMIRILKSLPGKKEVIDPGVKGIETVGLLLKTRNSADEITDYARSTIVFDDLPSVYLSIDRIREHFNVISIDDHYLNPYPEMYRDINIVFEDPINLHIGEIQINSRAMISVKNNIGHELFDKIRKLKIKAKLEQRDLSKEELDLLEDLQQMSKVGYNAAFVRSYAPIRLGVYGVCIREGKVLMTKTFAGDKYIYNFPGGGLDYPESLADCLSRECKEELGCEISIKNLFATSDKLYDCPFFNSSKFNVYYSIDILGEIDTSLEGAVWFDLDKMPLDMMLDCELSLVSKICNQGLSQK